jgi:hypothetical protein
MNTWRDQNEDAVFKNLNAHPDGLIDNEATDHRKPGEIS